MKTIFPHAKINRSLGDFASEVNTLVDTLFNVATGHCSEAGGGFSPRFDIHESDDKFVVLFDLPGVKLGDVQIELDGDDLIVYGSRTSPYESSEDHHNRVERWSGNFRRSLRLPRSVDREQVSAEYRDGVLMILLPKLRAAASRKIQIRGSDASPDSPPTANA